MGFGTWEGGWGWVGMLDWVRVSCSDGEVTATQEIMRQMLVFFHQSGRGSPSDQILVLYFACTRMSLIPPMTASQPGPRPSNSIHLRGSQQIPPYYLSSRPKTRQDGYLASSSDGDSRLTHQRTRSHQRHLTTASIDIVSTIHTIDARDTIGGSLEGKGAAGGIL